MPALTPESFLKEQGLKKLRPEDIQEMARKLLKEQGALPEAKVPLQARELYAFVEGTTQGIVLEPWQRAICSRLQELPDQQGQRLLLHAPPQYGKSLIVSQRFPAWVLGKHPNHRIRLACYNETHAEEFSKVNLLLMQDDLFAKWFPEPKSRVTGRQAAIRWSTDERLTYRDGQPSFVALGLGSGFTGLGAEIVIIDDPYKNADEAFSDAIGKSIWQWWTQVVAPRLNPATNVVVMFHRWKADDLAGKLYEAGGWEMLRYPAIADGEPGDATGLPIGSPLSSRFSLAHLERVKTATGKLEFAALFQGIPGDAQGNLIRSDYFRSYWPQNDSYVLQRGDRTERIRKSDVWRFSAVDWASSDAKTSDWTVCTTWGVTPRNDLLLLNVRRGREEGPEAKLLVRSELQKWDPAFVVVEKNGLGLPMTQDLEREGWPIRGVFQSKSKPVRAQSLATAYENGRIFHPVETEWLAVWTKELLAFPAGSNDDQLDTGSLAARAVMGGVSAVISDFASYLHVAADVLHYEDDLPLLLGWSFEPVHACVACQHVEGQLRALACLVGHPGEGIEAFALRVAVWAKDAVCPEGRVLSDLEKMSFGPHEWLGGAKGNLIAALYMAGEEQGERLGLEMIPCMDSQQDRDEGLRKRCRSLQEGAPALLVDPEANELITALAGGYCYKTDNKGLPQPGVEENAAKSLVGALGCAASLVSVVRARHVDPLTRYAQAMSRGASTTRAAGYRGRGRR